MGTGRAPGMPASWRWRPARACPQLLSEAGPAQGTGGPAGMPGRAALGVNPAHCLVLWYSHFCLMSQSSAIFCDLSAEPQWLWGGDEAGRRWHHSLLRDDAVFQRIGKQGLASPGTSLLFPLSTLLKGAPVVKFQRLPEWECPHIRGGVVLKHPSTALAPTSKFLF